MGGLWETAVADSMGVGGGGTAKGAPAALLPHLRYGIPISSRTFFACSGVLKWLLAP